MSNIASEQLAMTFVDVADTLVDEFDVIEFLEMVTSRTSDLIAAHAAGLLLADEHGRLQLMSATTQEIRTVELFQVQNLEGPCQDCFRQGAAVISADLTSAAGRWPRFAPLAVDAGFRSVHAFRLRPREDVIGALNLFSRSTGDLDAEDARVVQALADVTTIGLLQERVIRRSEILTEQLQTALNSRIVVEQAKGALAQLHDCTPDEAFTLLRGWCRHHHQRLVEVARGVISEPADYPSLTTPDINPADSSAPQCGS